MIRIAVFLVLLTQAWGLSEKRGAFQKIIEGPCVTSDDCHERCQPTGLFFGRCLIDRCLCYTLPRKREVKMCKIHQECEAGCSGGLHIGRCLEDRCVCLALPGKRQSNIVHVKCNNNEECHEHCQPLGLFFGRCMIDQCYCYTLP